jgi:hypothetical protein
MAMTKSIILSLVIATGALVASAAYADTVVTTTPGASIYTGTISQVDPSAQTIMLKTETATSPMTITYTPQTTFVDAQGNVVSYQSILNSPVRVEYSTEGGRTIVKRVISVGPAR